MPLLRKSQVQPDFQDPSAMPAPPPPPSGAPTGMPSATPTAPPAMPDLSMGGMPSGFDASMSMQAPPTTPMSTPTSGGRQEILGPIESPTQIFYDMDIANFIENNIHFSVDDLTKLIWEEYGGSEEGRKDPSKLGARSDNSAKASPEDAQAEREATEKTKWKRLPEGKSIEDIISYSDLGKIVSGLLYGITTKIALQSAAPAGGTAMASTNRVRIIIAKNLDREYLFKQSDTIINEIYKKIKLS